MPDPSPPPTAPGEESPLDFVEDLVAQCLATPEPERDRTMERLCLEYPVAAGELRARLRALHAVLQDIPSTIHEKGEPTGSRAATVAPLPEGTPATLGEYRILRKIGGGGMGVVCEAEQARRGRRVALKVIRPELLHFERAQERFQREVEAAGRLRHPGIVPVFSVGEEGGVPFFVMELVEGCTLAEVLDAMGSLAPERLTGADLGRAVAREAGGAEGHRKHAGAGHREEAGTSAGDRAGAGADLPAAWRRGWVQACLDLARQVALPSITRTRTGSFIAT